ncbi:MAG TPA: hypothetical protein VKX16_06085 [Chloroflexota bacterium]|nr:hypothetical protein [Chloroflexota bacterium]
MSSDVTTLATVGAGTPVDPVASRRPAGLRRVRRALALGLGPTGLLGAAALIWLATGPNPVSSRVLGIPNVSLGTLPASASVMLSSSVGVFHPRAVVVARGGTVRFRNDGGNPLTIRSAAGSPASFLLRLPAHGSASVRLNRLGLYHYFDSSASRPLRMVAGNEVLRSTVPNRPPREGWIAVIPAMPGLSARLAVPQGNDLFAPKALVTVVGAHVVVVNHDSDTHNFVIDPASPSGAAFMIEGSSQEPPSGWQRVLVVQQAGLYHVYCTMHTRVVDTLDGWRVVTARPAASGYRDHNPMEAWIIALPATS